MSEVRTNDSQRTPVPNTGRPIADMVCEDIQRRAEHGQRKYGVKLQAHNGRNALQDAYEEALDLCHYLKQKLVEEADRANRRRHQHTWDPRLTSLINRACDTSGAVVDTLSASEWYELRDMLEALQ